MHSSIMLRDVSVPARYIKQTVYQVYKKNNNNNKINKQTKKKKRKRKWDSLWAKDRLHRSSLAHLQRVTSLFLSSARPLCGPNWKFRYNREPSKDTDTETPVYTAYIHTTYGKPSLHSSRPTGELRRLITVSKGWWWWSVTTSGVDFAWISETGSCLVGGSGRGS